MRLTCPLCGPRDRREFYYYGDAVWLDRPAPDAPPEAWTAYIHLRDNPAGETTDLWYHEQGCAAWLRVRRDTVTHDIYAVEEVAAPLSVPTYPTGGPPSDPPSVQDPMVAAGVTPPGLSAPPDAGPPKPRTPRKKKAAPDAS